MATFQLPDLGEGLAEAEIREWHVKPGDHMRADQPMVSVETAKAVVEVPCPFSGIVIALHGAPGDIVATGAALIDYDTGTVVGTMPATAVHEFVDSAARAHPCGAETPRMRAVPMARALARRLGIDLGTVAGSGPDGIIRLEDVLAVAPTNAVGAAVAAPAALTLPAGASLEPLRGPRRAMAHSMSMSRDQICGSTVCDDADIHAWRSPGDYTPRLIRALIRACTAEPALNAWFDAASQARILMRRINLAIAVDTPDGLIVPVLHDAAAHPPADLRALLAALTDGARRRRTAPGDLRDFTLMLSNFGTLAGRYGIPRVVPPAVAILGCGTARIDAVVADQAVVAHRRLPLSLSFDHRCVTGAEACRFLAAVIADLQLSD